MICLHLIESKDRERLQITVECADALQAIVTRILKLINNTLTLKLRPCVVGATRKILYGIGLAPCTRGWQV